MDGWWTDRRMAGWIGGAVIALLNYKKALTWKRVHLNAIGASAFILPMGTFWSLSSKFCTCPDLSSQVRSRDHATERPVRVSLVGAKVIETLTKTNILTIVLWNEVL